MHPARFLLIGLVLPLAGCGADGPEPDARVAAPDVTWQQDGAEVSFEALRGHPVVLLFADADSPAWAALDDVLPDLTASGATVLGVVSDDRPLADSDVHPITDDDLAESFQIREMPTAVVVDAEGWVRGRTEQPDADALLALAAPVLLDHLGSSGLRSLQNLATAPPTRGELEQWVREGAVLVDTRPDAERDQDGIVPHALPLPFDQLALEALPADLSSTLVFLGADAPQAAAQAAAWGFPDSHALPSIALYLQLAPEPPTRSLPPDPFRTTARTVKG